MEERLNWLIFGAGAIGTYIGGSLILHGQKVAFLEQGDSVTAILEQGLRANIHGQENRILHPDIFSFLSDALTHSAYDIAVFALKSYHTQSALDQILPYLNNFPPILCLQNGVENELLIGQTLGQDKVIAGTVTSAVSRRGVGDIILERNRGIGIADGSPLARRIQPLLSAAGLNAHLYSSAASMKWSKMLTNLMANASSAILDLAPSQILANPVLYSIEIAQLREATRVSRALGNKIIDLPGTPVRLFAWVVNKLPERLSRVFISRMAGKGRGNKMPSFHIDLHSGRGMSEVDYLNGAVVRSGEPLGIPAPVNRWLNQTLINLTRGVIPLDEYSNQPGKYVEQVLPLVQV